MTVPTNDTITTDRSLNEKKGSGIRPTTRYEVELNWNQNVVRVTRKCLPRKGRTGTIIGGGQIEVCDEVALYEVDELIQTMMGQLALYV